MKYVKNLMEEIFSIPSPGGDTSTITERLRKEFEGMGVPVTTTRKGAIMGTITGENDEEHKLISAHVDTLGAVVKEIKSNGRLRLSAIGGYAWTAYEGENLIIKTMKGKEYTGVLLPDKASIHVHSEEVRETLRTEENMEVRIDEDVHTKEDTLKLGIRVGDFVAFDTRTIFTDNGYIKSRYIDDKACVAVLFGVCKYLKDNNIKPENTVHFFLSNFEEMGHGVTAIPEKTVEMLALDIGTVGEGHTSDEHCVTICAKDSRTPYDFGFKKKLVELAEEGGIDYRVDVHYRYGSDASLSILQGVDVNFACIGPGVDATHHYERTHIDAIENNIKLVIQYII
ncbi:putative aminopeptidase YsdC [bioreactor metagenome]|uniref:Putative aminopeptidase YsdC n=1 Tax=bioreactor metagenome TaxID=1076179 RepID=A0A645CWG4_9ZZZZ